MASELFSIRAYTDGSSTSGTCTIVSDLIYGTASYIRIPKGMSLKIWGKRVMGEGATRFDIQYTHDVTEATPTWTTLCSENLASAGEMSLEKRRPLILKGYTGKEAVRINWSQASAANACLELDIEVE